MSVTFESHLKYYKSQHRTLGCKLTHMVGVPLLFFSVPALLFSWRAALKLFVGGWGMQAIGHFVFEKNRPVMWFEGNKLYTAGAGIIFVWDCWGRLLTGRPLLDDEEKEESPAMTEVESELQSEIEPIPSEVIELQKRIHRRRQAL